MTRSRLFGTCLVACAILLPGGTACVQACIEGALFTNVGNDTQDRYFHRASVLSNGFVMVSGGLRLQVFPSPSLVSLNGISFFNPSTNTFSASFTPLGGGGPVAPVLATARSSHTQTTLLDGRVLITGGNVNAVGTNPGTPTASVEIFNPQTGLVSAGPAMSVARSDHRASLLPDGRVVVSGMTSWQIFDPNTSTWSANFSMEEGRIAHAAIVLADFAGAGQHRVLLIAGAGSAPDTLELLDPDTGTSTSMLSMLDEGVDDLAASLLDDGRVLIVGGQSMITGNTLNFTYLYDPQTDVISPGPVLPNRAGGIADHQLVEMGRYIAVFGGEEEQAGADTELNYAAVFDRATESWTWNGAMNHIHDDFASATLNDGRILLIGGGVPFLGVEGPSRAVETYVQVMVPKGDMDANQIVDLSDLLGFVSVILDPTTATARETCAADGNEDESLDGRDILPFLDAVVAP